MKHLEEEFENIEMKKKEQQQTKKMFNKQREKELEQRKAVYSSREKTVRNQRAFLSMNWESGNRQ